MSPHCLDYHKSATLRKMYKFSIIPMLDMKDWDVPKFVDEKEFLSSKY